MDANNYMYLISNGARKLIYTGAGSITLIGEDDNKVYFVEDSAIYALDYIADAEPVKISNSDKTYMLDNANLIDIDGRRIFVMAEYTAEDESKHYYLNVIDRYDTETKSEFVGEFADNETPAEPEEVDEDEILEEEPSLWVE